MDPNNNLRHGGRHRGRGLFLDGIQPGGDSMTPVEKCQVVKDDCRPCPGDAAAWVTQADGVNGLMMCEGCVIGLGVFTGDAETDDDDDDNDYMEVA
jgi:hypothetical protein